MSFEYGLFKVLFNAEHKKNHKTNQHSMYLLKKVDWNTDYCCDSLLNNC